MNRRVVNTIAKILVAHDSSEKTARVVAKEIAAVIPLCPDEVWLVVTEIENTGRDERVFACEGIAWEDVGDILGDWLDSIATEEQYEGVEGEAMKARVAELLDQGKVQEARTTWMLYQENGLAEPDAEIWIIKLPLNGIHVSVPSKK